MSVALDWAQTPCHLSVCVRMIVHKHSCVFSRTCENFVHFQLISFKILNPPWQVLFSLSIMQNQCDYEKLIKTLELAFKVTLCSCRTKMIRNLIKIVNELKKKKQMNLPVYDFMDFIGNLFPRNFGSTNFFNFFWK